MKIILQRDYYTKILHKTRNKIEEIVFNGFSVVACVATSRLALR